MACRPAPACKAALAEATRLWPNRRTTSDGICASSTHSKQNPTSDHEPNAQGYATAFDLSDDKGAGCDADALVEMLRRKRDPRVKYVIAERRMYSSYSTSTRRAWEWGTYTGSNPHSSHVHVSIKPEWIHNTDPWWKDEDEVTETDINKIVDRVTAKVLAALKPTIDKVHITRESVAGRNALNPGSPSTTGRIDARTVAIEKKAQEILDAVKSI